MRLSVCNTLIHFHYTVDFGDKPEAWKESYGSWKQKSSHEKMLLTECKLNILW